MPAHKPRQFRLQAKPVLDELNTGVTLRPSCVFCASIDSKRAIEHVFPLWMLKEFSWKDDAVAPTHFGVDGDVISDRSHTLSSLVAGHVCECCNTGWMSALERAAKSTIGGLALGTTRLESLPANDLFNLARWVTKTAYTLHSGANWRKLVAPDHYKHLKASPESLPKGLLVTAVQIAGNDGWCWTQSTSWILRSGDIGFSRQEAVLAEQQGYKISICIKNLIATVAFNPLERTNFSLVPGFHATVFPAVTEIDWYGEGEELPNNPCGAMMFQNGSIALSRRFKHGDHLTSACN